MVDDKFGAQLMSSKLGTSGNILDEIFCSWLHSFSKKQSVHNVLSAPQCHPKSRQSLS
jgi:hypothetical protein